MAFKPLPLTPEGILNNIKSGILNAFIDELEPIMNDKKPKEIYFHDIIHGVLDRNTPSNVKLCAEIIGEFFMEESHIDEGLIDTSTPARMMITSAYVHLENELFKDGFFSEYLQKFYE